MSCCMTHANAQIDYYHATDLDAAEKIADEGFCAQYVDEEFGVGREDEGDHHSGEAGGDWDGLHGLHWVVSLVLCSAVWKAGGGVSAVDSCIDCLLASLTNALPLPIWAERKEEFCVIG